MNRKYEYLCKQASVSVGERGKEKNGGERVTERERERPENCGDSLNPNKHFLSISHCFNHYNASSVHLLQTITNQK